MDNIPSCYSTDCIVDHFSPLFVRLQFLRSADFCYLVRQEHLFDIETTCNCVEDEGRPLGAGLQEQASNHLKLLWSRARVVSIEEKS